MALFFVHRPCLPAPRRERSIRTYSSASVARLIEFRIHIFCMHHNVNSHIGITADEFSWSANQNIVFSCASFTSYTTHSQNIWLSLSTLFLFVHSDCFVCKQKNDDPKSWSVCLCAFSKWLCVCVFVLSLHF